jgi:transmembrane sensor
MPPPGFDPKRTVADAAAWNVRLDSGELTDAERARLHAWLSTPGNAREYDAQRQLLGWIQDVPADVKADLERSLSVGTERAPSRRWTAQPLWLGAVAAAIVFAILGWLLWTMPPGFLSHSYASGIGEVRTFGLPDGSTTSLNTRTHLKWVGGGHERRVRLLGGEVLFEVRHDPAQPFQIELKHSRITVLGTRFDVYEKPNDDVVVTVLIGKVVVQGFSPSGAWTEQLTANQRIEYTPAGNRKVSTVDASTAADWREGILRSEGLSLENVVRELGRYTSLKIEITDPSLNVLTVGGVFDIHDVRSALERVAKSADVPITVTRSGDAFVLRRGPEPAPADGKGS